MAIHLWSAAPAWFTAYQDDMLIAVLPMYIPMVLLFGIHFAMLLAGKTRRPKWMFVFHPVIWNILLVRLCRDRKRPSEIIPRGVWSE